MRALFSVCALSVACAACWSLLSDLPDVTGGVPMTQDDASTGPDSADAGVTTDAARGDSAFEGGADGSGSTFCSTLMPAPFFCDDFDVGTLGATWSMSEVSSGTLALKGGTLEAASDCAGTLPTLEQLEHVVLKPTKLARLAFSMRATSLSGTPVFRIAGLYVKPTASTDYRVDLVWDGNHLAIFELRGGTLYKGPGLANFDIKSAARQYELTVDLKNNAAVLRVDGAQHIDKGISAPVTMTDWTRVDLGLSVTECSAAIGLVYDDFIYDREDP